MKLLRDFLATTASKGVADSEGYFTVDPSGAARTMGGRAMPSTLHYLLKIVQVANRQEAPNVEVWLSQAETRIDFKLTSSRIAEVRDSLSGALRTSGSGESLADDLSLALLGAISAGNTEASWLLREAEVSWTLGLDAAFGSVGLSQLAQDRAERGGEEGRCSFVVRHQPTWKFWEQGKRKSDLLALLRTACAFSQAKIVVEGKELPAPNCSFFNERLREFHGSSFNVSTGIMETTKTRVAATNILFAVARPGKSAVRVAVPDLGFYSTRSSHLHLWTQGLQEKNPMRPDGEEVCAWMLQFVKDGQRTGGQSSGPFSAVIAFNIHGPGNVEPLYLKVVRHGVLVLDSQLDSSDDDRLEPFVGCSLLLADDGCRTDGGGFQLVQDEHLIEAVLRYKGLIDAGHAYFEEAVELVHFS